MKKPELNYNIELAYKTEWWRYYGEYKYAVELIFKQVEGGEITVISLPLGFLIRHTLELGYKMNLIELEKVSGIEAKIDYKGGSAHKIDDLHYQFELQMREIFKKYNVDKDIVKQFNKYNSNLTKLKRQIHKLDELSYSFRYPVKSDGQTPNFEKVKPTDSNIINFKEIKELFDNSIALLTYSTDVVNDIVTESEK